MPVNYSYQAADHTICVHCSGELTIEEIVNYFQAIETDPSIPQGTVELVDLAEVSNFNVGYHEAATMPTSYSPAHRNKAIQGTIVFGANRVNSSLLQLIEAYFRKQMPQHFFEIAATQQEAEAKLRELRDSVGKHR